MSLNLLERRTVYFFCVQWQMRFEKPPVLIARAGGEKKMQTYLAPDKILAIKKQRPNVFAFCALALFYYVTVVRCTEVIKCSTLHNGYKEEIW